MLKSASKGNPCKHKIAWKMDILIRDFLIKMYDLHANLHFSTQDEIWKEEKIDEIDHPFSEK